MTTATSKTTWSYARAFERNLGLIGPKEQERLRHVRVAIAGMGGIGGVDAVTLARLGIGRFTIADPDVFDVVNTNRQYGATVSAEGRPKARVMAEILRDINPEAEIRVIDGPVSSANLDEFLDDAQLFIDGIEVFEMEPRLLLFRAAREMGIHAITAGPVGFSGVWIVFEPDGMTFERYFDLSPGMSTTEQLVSFVVGVAPAATHRTYMDLRHVKPEARTAPSVSLACQLASGAMACEALKILLRRGKLRAAPWYQQFDPWMGRFVQRKLRWGNRHPLQRLKRRILLSRFGAKSAGDSGEA